MRDGRLVSPHQEAYSWVSKHQSAESWDDEKAAHGLVGLSAIWRLDLAVPWEEQCVVLHVAGYGRLAVDRNGFRAQHMEVLRIVHRHPDARVHEQLLEHWEDEGVRVERANHQWPKLHASGAVEWVGERRGRPAKIIRHYDGRIEVAELGNVGIYQSASGDFHLTTRYAQFSWRRGERAPRKALPHIRAIHEMVLEVLDD
jgi:hypothetical protein